MVVQVSSSMSDRHPHREMRVESSRNSQQSQSRVKSRKHQINQSAVCQSISVKGHQKTPCSQKEESINKKKKSQEIFKISKIIRKKVQEAQRIGKREVAASTPDFFSGIFSKSCLLYISFGSGYSLFIHDVSWD